jgi:SAM-dependent methyltransferase
VSDISTATTPRGIESSSLTGALHDEFRLYFDEKLSRPTPYGSGGAYFRRAKERMDRTFALIEPEVQNSCVLDIGASPFYLLTKAAEAGARACHGIYFAHDSHPLKGINRIYSPHGEIQIDHTNIETDNLPLATNSVDIVTACEILEHCEYFPSRVAGEIRRVLRPSGLLCITVPNVCSAGNILKLMSRRNIYFKYRADPTGRHKHEFTLSELKAFIAYLGMHIVKAGFLPSPTSDLSWSRPAYRMIAAVPGIRQYSPVLYILARQPNPKPEGDLGPPPDALYDNSLSIEA